MIMAAKENKKEKVQSALKWLHNTTVEPEKIADYLGFRGDYRARFLKFGRKYRKAQFSK